MPTWIFVMLFIMAACSTILYFLILLNFDLFESMPMVIDCVSVNPGTREYNDVIKIFKQALWASAIFSLVFSSIFGYLVYRRKKTTINEG
jgi:hypothetical protein